jgi:hypothetical protein
MRTNRHIVLFVGMISFFLMLVSCGPSAEEKQMMEPMEIRPVAESTISAEEISGQTLEQTFEADTLTAEQLTAFQQRGAEKLADFINYMELMSNKKYDPRLREEVRKQVEALFTDPATPIAIAINNDNKEKPLTAFLDAIYKNNYDSIKVKTDSVVLQQPEKGIPYPYLYKSIVTGKVSVAAYKNKKIVFSSAGLREAVILIQKVEKDFGGDKKQVWEVMLGEMK